MTSAMQMSRALALCGLCACASAPRVVEPSRPAVGAGAHAARRFAWVEASCSDGALDLAQLGFERSVELEPKGAGYLLTMSTQLAARGCRSSGVLELQPARGDERGLYAVSAGSWARLPADAACGAEEREPTLAELRLHDDDLELVLRDSPWCRGLDARFAYRAAPPALSDAEALMMRLAALMDHGDAEALAQLFASDATLLEPFSATEGAGYARHEGRRAIAEYFADAFASVRWHALRLLSVEPAAAPGQHIASWEYMDSELASPLRGRTLVLLAGSELLEAEIQLLTDPEPAAQLAEPDSSRASTSTP